MATTDSVPIISNTEKNLECRIHTCPTTLFSTFKLIFPDLAAVMPSRAKLTSGEASFNLQIIAVWQQTTHDMSGYSDRVQTERDEKTSNVRYTPLLRTPHVLFPTNTGRS